MRSDEVGTHLKHPETINNNIKKIKDFLFLPLYIKNVMLSFKEHLKDPESILLRELPEHFFLEHASRIKCERPGLPHNVASKSPDRSHRNRESNCNFLI